MYTATKLKFMSLHAYVIATIVYCYITGEFDMNLKSTILGGAI